MQLRDTTTGTVIAMHVEVAAHFWARFRGLMLRPQLAPGEGLLIRPGSSIHMMFMRFPIDAIFCDKDHCVTSVAHNLRPWTGLAFGKRGAKYVIELPSGAAAGVVAGHQLQLLDDIAP